MKKSKKTFDYYKALFEAIYDDYYSDKSHMDQVRKMQDMYDKYHGKDGWNYNLLTGLLEKKN
ncbi:MAG: hypothetical protein EBU90_02240 [Proteobacteria bacterium]|nr:hypothetical protein [Pseudomonadota bacterium]NBP13053.1 hypothetical protein [bacterium]